MDDLLKIQGWLNTIETQVVGPPKWITEKQVFEYENISVEVVAYLKAVRAVQSLTSIRLLLENGLFIDFYTIVRCVFDCVVEIDFLLEDYPKYSSQVENFLQNFRGATIDEVLTQSTNPVLSKKIRNASARVREGEHLTFEQAKTPLDRMHKIFSGYVHAQYSHIMEIYGGPPGQLKFHVSGITSEQKKHEYAVWIGELDNMVIHALGFMAKQFNCDELLIEIIKHFEQSQGN